MSWPIVLAEGSWEGPIWILFGLIWFIAQIAAQLRKRSVKRPGSGLSRTGSPPAAESAARESTPKDLENFLRALGMETPLPPVHEPEPQTQVVQTPLAHPVPPAPGLRTRKRQRRASALAAQSAPLPPALEPVLDALPPPRLEGAEVSMGRLRTMMVIPKLIGLHVRVAQLPLLALQGRGANTPRNSAQRLALGDRHAVRRAMLHRLILEPPHAFRY